MENIHITTEMILKKTEKVIKKTKTKQQQQQQTNQLVRMESFLLY